MALVSRLSSARFCLLRFGNQHGKWASLSLSLSASTWFLSCANVILYQDFATRVIFLANIDADEDYEVKRLSLRQQDFTFCFD